MMKRSIQERVRGIASILGFGEQVIVQTFPHLQAEGEYVWRLGEQVKDSDLPSFIDHTLLKPQAKQVCSFPPLFPFLPSSFLSFSPFSLKKTTRSAIYRR
jgi:hypothetical protein